MMLNEQGASMARPTGESFKQLQEGKIDVPELIFEHVPLEENHSATLSKKQSVETIDSSGTKQVGEATLNFAKCLKNIGENVKNCNIRGSQFCIMFITDGVKSSSNSTRLMKKLKNLIDQKKKDL